jgi:AraC-like DNA-binding protein
MFYAGNVSVYGEHVEHLGFLYQSWNVRDYTIQPSENQVFVLTLVHSKGGIHQIDQQKHHLKGYQIHLIFPGQASSFSFVEETLAHQFRISKQNFEKLCLTLPINTKLLRDHPVLDIAQHEFEKLRDELSKIGSELCRFQPLFTIIGSRTATSLQEINRLMLNRTGRIPQYYLPTTLDRLLELIELNYKQEHCVAYYANLLNMTPYSLRKLTNQNLGILPLKLIHNRLLKEAMHLLSLGPSPIKVTMMELGFQELSTFAHFFKKRTQMSPSEYQKKSLPVHLP